MKACFILLNQLRGKINGLPKDDLDYLKVTVEGFILEIEKELKRLVIVKEVKRIYEEEPPSIILTHITNLRRNKEITDRLEKELKQL